MAKSFRVMLKKSTIGCTQDQQDAVRCLGLRKVGQEVVLKDNPAVRGQIFKVQHLLEVSTESKK